MKSSPTWHRLQSCHPCYICKPPSPSHTLIPPYFVQTLGITGGIGSGKSTVAAMLGEKPGVRVVSADDEARRLMVEDEGLRRRLIERFGADTFLEDGSPSGRRLENQFCTQRKTTSPCLPTRRP